MKKISVLLFAVFLLIAAHSALAQSRISPQVAKAYAQNCAQQENPYISAETKDIFCQCTASYMQKTMSMARSVRSTSKGKADACEPTNERVVSLPESCSAEANIDAPTILTVPEFGFCP